MNLLLSKTLMFLAWIFTGSGKVLTLSQFPKLQRRGTEHWLRAYGLNTASHLLYPRTLNIKLDFNLLATLNNFSS